MAHRSGMSSVLRSLSQGDENTKKTAQLLLQLLFYNDNTPGIMKQLKYLYFYEVIVLNAYNNC